MVYVMFQVVVPHNLAKHNFLGNCVFFLKMNIFAREHLASRKKSAAEI